MRNQNAMFTIQRLLILLLCMFGARTLAQTDAIEDVCPANAIALRSAEWTGEGYILTAFDGSSLWVYDIARSTRYPLPQTRPCLSNCQLSPDGRWLIYMDPETSVFTRMRPDGTERSPVGISGAELQWWSESQLLVWNAEHRALLFEPQTGVLEELSGRALLAVQPGGRWALQLVYADGVFRRALVNLDTIDSDTPQRALLAPDAPYFNANAWSPDGLLLAYVGRGAYDETRSIAGAELYTIRPGDAIPSQRTFFSSSYGAARIGGANANGLAWSPDGRSLAFWAMELSGPQPETDAGPAFVHVLDLFTNRVRRYCGFSTTEHTPNPPRLAWSPDGRFLAFAGNVPGDDKGYLLLALDLERGVFTELSDGIFPALGSADVYGWGRKP